MAALIHLLLRRISILFRLNPKTTRKAPVPLPLKMVESHALGAVWALQGQSHDSICSELVCKCRTRTVKWAIVLLYVSLLRRSNTSCGGGETQILLLLQLSIQLLDTI